MTRPAAFLLHNQYPFFSLHIRYHEDSIEITMRLFSPYKKTSAYPETLALLQQHFPQVLTTECFNDDHICFMQEVVDTELGHIFEHIILQYMCDEAFRLGLPTHEFEGRTWWDCSQESENSFRIAIFVSKAQKPIFLSALQQSIELLNLVLESPTSHEVNSAAKNTEITTTLLTSLSDNP